jgi:hypothetical protein
MVLNEPQLKMFRVVGQLTGGEAEGVALNDDVMRVAGLKRHEWSALDDELMKLGLVNGNSTTERTELTKAGAALYRLLKKRHGWS